MRSSPNLLEYFQPEHADKLGALLADHFKKSGGATDDEARYVQAYVTKALTGPDPGAKGTDPVNDNRLKNELSPEKSKAFPTRTKRKWARFVGGHSASQAILQTARGQHQDGLMNSMLGDVTEALGVKAEGLDVEGRLLLLSVLVT